MRRLLIPVLAAFAVLTFAAAEAANRTLEVGDYLDFETVRNPRISPDGDAIVYTRRWVDQKKDRMASSLWIMNADGTRNRELTKGSGALWSPDGQRIAFVKPDDEGHPQIFVRWMDAEGNVTQITRGDLKPRGMVWSPDGKHIAFVARVLKKTDWTIKLPPRPKKASWTDDPVIVESYHFRQDRVGLTNDGHDHLFIVPSDGGTPRQLTDGDWNVGARRLGVIAVPAQLSWSPDGRYIAFDGLAGEDWEMNFFVSHLYVIEAATGEMRQVTQGNGNWTGPVFSPDGGKIAFRGFPEWNSTYPSPDLWVIDFDGANQTAIGAGMDDGPSNITWASNGSGVYFNMNSRGGINVHFASLKGKVRAVTSGLHALSFSSVSDKGVAAGVKASYTEPGDVVRFKISNGSNLKRLTQVNADLLSAIDLAEVEEIWYDSTEGARVHGWIMKPPGFDAEKRYPLILEIHGGPHGMYNAGFSISRQEHAAHGYVVLYVNPRGSTGYGSAFANAIDNAYPGDRDYADLMAGVDAALAGGYVDSDRLFITGCSGGGILTTWTIGQTDRFKAAVARCPVVNWLSMASTTDVAGWAAHFFKPAYWEDPTTWLEHSPIMHVGKVTTPTLLMTGMKDLRTPIAQAEEYYGALKILGVPTKLIPMRGEYHGTGSIPSNWMRTQLYVRKWFEQYDPGAGEKATETAATGH